MWDPPADEGGAMVTHYIVEKRESSRIMWSIISEKLEDCIVTVSRLIKGNEYIFRVRGVNKYGVGDPLESEPVIAQNSFGTLFFFLNHCLTMLIFFVSCSKYTQYCYFLLYSTSQPTFQTSGQHDY